jgi:hypothetical protein
MTQHKHAATIKAWADGEKIECLDRGGWVDCPGPTWQDYAEYRVKPAAPAKVYPNTRMTDNELCGAYHSSGTPLTSVANAALHHACDAGQVVPMAEVREVARNLNKRRYDNAQRALFDAGFALNVGTGEWSMPMGFVSSREMAIAEAVRNTCRSVIVTNGGPSYTEVYGRMSNIDLTAIIASVK